MRTSVLIRIVAGIALVVASAMPWWTPVEAAPKHDPYRVVKMILARDNGRGTAGTQVKSFKSTDNPLHCVVSLSKGKKGLRVHFRWSVVKVKGEEPQVIKEHVHETTGPKDTVIDNKLSLARDWPPGTYRVEAGLENGHSQVNVDFEITK